MEKREQITKSISARTRKPSSRLSYIFLDFSFFFVPFLPLLQDPLDCNNGIRGGARLNDEHQSRSVRNIIIIVKNDVLELRD